MKMTYDHKKAIVEALDDLKHDNEFLQLLDDIYFADRDLVRYMADRDGYEKDFLLNPRRAAGKLQIMADLAHHVACIIGKDLLPF